MRQLKIKEKFSFTLFVTGHTLVLLTVSVFILTSNFLGYFSYSFQSISKIYLTVAISSFLKGGYMEFLIKCLANIFLIHSPFEIVF